MNSGYSGFIWNVEPIGFANKLGGGCHRRRRLGWDRELSELGLGCARLETPAGHGAVKEATGYRTGVQEGCPGWRYELGR
jgi:hypothetical protein